MTSIFSAGQSISSIGKSMNAIARVEEHLATFMKKVIYFESFFGRMRSNLPTCIMDTATLLFQRCYEYRDEIRDELDSSVAYVADAGRWVVGMGDWNSKMERRLHQISELVLLANTLLSEYAVTGQVGAGGCRDELNAYLQILSTTVTLKNGPKNGQKTQRLRNPIQSTTAADVSSEMAALGTEISGAISEMFREGNSASGTTDPVTRVQSAIRFDDNDAMNPFTDSYRRPVDPYASVGRCTYAATDRNVRNLPNGILESPISERDPLEGPLSPVSTGEYECLDMKSIPNYAAFKSSAQLAARTQSNRDNNLAVGITRDGARRTLSESRVEDHNLFPLPTTAVSKSLDSTAFFTTTSPIKPMMDMNYSYDFQCEVAHNPFITPDTQNSMVPICTDTSDLPSRPPQSTDLSIKLAQSIQPPRGGRVAWSAKDVQEADDESKARVVDSATDQDLRHSDDFDLFGPGKSQNSTCANVEHKI